MNYLRKVSWVVGSLYGLTLLLMTIRQGWERYDWAYGVINFITSFVVEFAIYLGPFFAGVYLTLIAGYCVVRLTEHYTQQRRLTR